MYAGAIEDANSGKILAQNLGKCPVAVLANHGVIVTGPTPAAVVYRAASFDRQCRLAYDVLSTGRRPRPVPPSTRKAMHDTLVERAIDVYWSGAVRQTLKAHRDVVD